MARGEKPLTVTRAGVVGTVIVLGVAATCVRLGVWQLNRLGQRDARNRLLVERMAEEPVRLGPAIPAITDTAGLVYRRAVVEGRFDHDRTIVLSGRSLRGVPGVHVLTPLVPEQGHIAVLVNRGWMPAPDAATVNYDSLRVPQSTSLTGLLLPFPGTSQRRRSNQTNADTGIQRVWFAPDAAAIRRQVPYPLFELQIQALPERGALNFPVRLASPTLDRGPHLGYAIQWFSFAAIALIGWFTLMIRTGEVRFSGGSKKGGAVKAP